MTLFAFRFVTTLARLTLDSRPYVQARHGFIRLRVTLSVLAFGATANYRELFWVRDAYCVCSYLSNICDTGSPTVRSYRTGTGYRHFAI